MTSTTGMACNLCGGVDLLLLVDFGSHPVSKHYLVHAADIRPTWPVRLYFCESCGLTQLQGSCPAEVLYDNYVTLSSWKPQPHALGQIDRIQKLEGLSANSTVIEIGCNDGDFLRQLVHAGFANVVGVEPSRDAYVKAIAKGLRCHSGIPDTGARRIDRERARPVRPVHFASEPGTHGRSARCAGVSGDCGEARRPCPDRAAEFRVQPGMS